MLDYGAAAAQIGAAANNLNALLASVNQSAPELEKLSQQTTANADRFLRRLFWMGLILIVILLAGSVVAGLIYQRLSGKPAASSSGPSAKPPD